MSHRAWLVASLAGSLLACAGPPASIEYVETVPARPRIGEIVTVKFRLLDYRGVPQAGSLVTFSLQGASGGVTLNPTMAMSQKGSGEATTQLVATAGAASVVVVANAGDMKIALSPPLTFSGAAASAGQMTFQCGAIAGQASGGIHAIGAFDQERHLIAGVKVRCTAHTGDRNGDGVPGALVSFLTEAGTIGPTETTLTDIIGNATILYKTSLPLPRDTEPEVFSWNPGTTCKAGDQLCTGEYLVPLWMEPNTWTTNPLATILTNTPALNPNRLDEPRRRDPIRRLPNGMAPTNNPRDNLVTMIAWTTGEEAFTDQNQNGKFDDTEPFVDTTEPFVDSNDNGTWDTDERWVDSNGSGAWDGKNGQWDRSTYIWRQEKILWTGIPYGALYPLGQVDDGSNPEPTARGAQPAAGLPTIVCSRNSPPNGLGPLGSAIRFTILVADPWFNSPASDAVDDGCEKLVSSKSIDVNGGVSGFKFTNPPVHLAGFTVFDNLQREPNPGLMPPQPGCFPPPSSARQLWEASVRCKFTASPEEGHAVYIFDSVRGEIDNNIPGVP